MTTMEEANEGITDAPPPAAPAAPAAAPAPTPAAAFPDEAIAMLVALTGGDEASARALLEATAGNVQQAADLFLAGGLSSVTADVERDAELARSLAGGAGLVTAAAAGNGNAKDDAAAAGPFDPHSIDEEQQVRAPIPVMRDTLYGPAATYFRGGGGGGGIGAASAAGGGGRGNGGGGAAADAAAAAAAASSSYVPRRRPNDTRPGAAGAFSAPRASAAANNDEDENEEAAAADAAAAAAKKHLPPPPPRAPSGLAGLFAPPTGLLFAGDFQQAAEAASQARRWLVANVQCEAEFASHRLNRDTWRDPTLKMLLSESFVFWQGDASAEDGATVAQHYRLLPPAVAEALVEAASGRGGRRGGRGREGDLPQPSAAAGGGGGEQRARTSAPPSAAEVAKLIPAGSLPAILVVDPATGLAMRTWTGFVAAERLAEELGPFLDHAFDEPGARELAAAGAAAARRRRAAEAAATGSAAAAAPAGKAMTEEEELAAALALSAADAQQQVGGGGGGGGGEEDDEEELVDGGGDGDDDDDDDIDELAAAEEEEEDEEQKEEAAPAPPPPPPPPARPSSPPPVVAPEPAEGIPRLSVALRLPGGGRASRHFAKEGSTLLDLFEWCRSLLLLEEEDGNSSSNSSRRKFCLKEPFPGAVPMAREGAEGVSLESVCGGGGGATFLLHFVD